MGKIKIFVAMLALFTGIPGVLLGQIPCKDCDCIMENARSAAAAANFQLALRQYEAAKLCDTSFTDIVNYEMVRIFVRINGLKLEAERNERLANEKNDLLSVARDSVKIALDSALTAKLKTDEALKELGIEKQKAEDAARKETKLQQKIIAADQESKKITELILEKRHHEALEKITREGNEDVLKDTLIIKAFVNAGDRLLWRIRIRDIQLKKNRGIYLSPMLAIVAVDSSGLAHIISNATGKSFLVFDTKSTYLGGAFSKNGTRLALYNHHLVHQFEVSTTTDTTIKSFPFRYSKPKLFQAQHGDITGIRFSEDDSLYVLKDTAFFFFSEPHHPIYTGNHKILDLEPAIFLPTSKPKRKRKKGAILSKAIITVNVKGENEKRLVLSKRTRAGTYVAHDWPIKVKDGTGDNVHHYSPKKVLFGPNQEFLVTDRGEYLDFRSKKIARFSTAERISPTSKMIDTTNNTDNLFVLTPLNRIITKNRIEQTVRGKQTFRDELTARKIDGWKEVTLSHPEGDTILGFDLIPKQVNLYPWGIEDQAIPDQYYLLTYTGTNLSIWDWKSGNLISQAAISSGRIKQIIVSVDGRYIMLTTENDRMELWRIGTYADIKDQNLIIAVTEQEKENPENEENEN